MPHFNRNFLLGPLHLGCIWRRAERPFRGLLFFGSLRLGGKIVLMLRSARPLIACGGKSRASLYFPHGRREVKTTRQFLYSTGMLLLVSCVFACKVSDDAVAAAQQMTATSAALSTYYGAMAESLTDTISLNELNFTLFGVPFEDADREQIEQARAEILKRKDLAQSLGRLSSSMTALTKSKASSDVSTAATALGNEMVSIKALPKGSPVPEALGKAGDFLIQIVQQHEEKKAAQAMDGTLAARQGNQRLRQRQPLGRAQCHPRRRASGGSHFARPANARQTGSVRWRPPARSAGVGPQAHAPRRTNRAAWRYYIGRRLHNA